MTEGAEHTAALPPSASWPKALKQLALASLGARITWDLWSRPFNSASDEPAWLLLRSCAKQITRTHRVVTNDEAWNICMRHLQQYAYPSRAA